MKKIILNLIFLFTGVMVKAQVLLNLLVNTSSQILNIKVEVVLTDITNGQSILSGSSRIFALSPGAKQIQLSDLLPIQYNILNNSYAVNTNPDGFLPIGAFSVCYSILKENLETLDNIAEDCETIEIDPASPPILNTPEDLTETDQLTPLFTWLPPQPSYLFSNLTYDFKLTEVFKNQDITDAIQRNIPILYQNNISQSNLLYPTSINSLIPGKTYAWQIAANSNGLFVAKSEVWSFKVHSAETSTETQVPSYYYKLRRGSNASSFISNGFLKLDYKNENNDSSALMVIYNYVKKKHKINKVLEEVLKLHFNQNLIDLDLREVGGLKRKAIYTIELTNSKGEIYSGKFEYNPEN